MTTIASPRYTPEELAEFGSIITAKLTRAQEDLAAARESLAPGIEAPEVIFEGDYAQLTAA